MTTLATLAQQAMRAIEGGDSPRDSQLDRREVVAFLRQALNGLLKTGLMALEKQNDRLGAALCVATYPGLPVLGDEGQGCLYTPLPSFFVSLPFGKGLRSVFPDGMPHDAFIPRHNYSTSHGLPCGQRLGRPSYWVEGSRIVYPAGGAGMVTRHDKVTARLVVAAPGLVGENDPLPVYPEQAGEALGMALGFFSRRGEKDNLNNSKEE